MKNATRHDFDALYVLSEIEKSTDGVNQQLNYSEILSALEEACHTIAQQIAWRHSVEKWIDSLQNIIN